MSDGGRVLNGTVWTLVAVNVAALAASFLFAWATFDLLPDRYPVHFDGAGRPNRWVSGDSAEWFAIPIVALVMAVPMVGLGLGLPSIPTSQWNLPNKEAFVALPAERQAPIVRSVVLMMLVLAAVDTFLMLLLHIAMFRSTVTLRGPPMWPVAVVGVLYLALLTGWIVRLHGAMKRAVAGSSAAGEG